MSSLVFFFFFCASSRKINEGYRFLKDVAEKKRPKQKCKMAIKMQHNGIISFLNLSFEFTSPYHGKKKTAKAQTKVI